MSDAGWPCSRGPGAWDSGPRLEQLVYVSGWWAAGSLGICSNTPRVF